MRSIESALQLYRLDNYQYPTSAQGLEGLITKPADVKAATWQDGGYLKKVPVDPWGNPYIYTYPGQHGDFDLSSLGADGEPGGSKSNSDINNWELD